MGELTTIFWGAKSGFCGPSAVQQYAGRPRDISPVSAIPFFSRSYTPGNGRGSGPAALPGAHFSIDHSLHIRTGSIRQQEIHAVSVVRRFVLCDPSTGPHLLV